MQHVKLKFPIICKMIGLSWFKTGFLFAACQSVEWKQPLRDVPKNRCSEKVVKGPKYGCKRRSSGFDNVAGVSPSTFS